MQLIEVGAGGMGREVFLWLSHSIRDSKKYEIKGFLYDNLEALGALPYPVKVIGKIS